MTTNQLTTLPVTDTESSSEFVEVTELTPGQLTDQAVGEVIKLHDFIKEFGGGLLAAVQQQNPPIYSGQARPQWQAVFDGLHRKPFQAQTNAVNAACELLVKAGQPSVIFNAEMGTGKTMMGIMTAAVLHREGFPRTLVISPPHLVYKWRREILLTVPNAKVWILNGSDTLRKLLQIRTMHVKPAFPEFFILGRIRMRMGFNWEPSFTAKTQVTGDSDGRQYRKVAACPDCGEVVSDPAGNAIPYAQAKEYLSTIRMRCRNHSCRAPLWTLYRNQRSDEKSQAEKVIDSLRQIPSIGPKKAASLLGVFGSRTLAEMLEDNFHNFINLMNENGDLLFSDRQAKRMERFLGNHEITFGQGGYQPSEFIKRYLPKGYFGSMIVDEGHEYKNQGSAQGQAMAVLASQVKKTILLTGTLMGGYAEDLFHLLFRIDPSTMIEDGYSYNGRNSIGPAAMAFTRHHGIVIDEIVENLGTSHKTAKGNNKASRSRVAPGFGPKGIMQYVVPKTVFLKLKDIGGNVLPDYKEEFIAVDMTSGQLDVYRSLEFRLQQKLKSALAAGDHTLLGVVLNCLLAWPDCCFNEELVFHPRTRLLLASAPPIFTGDELMPKEEKLLEICKAEKRAGRRVLVYTTYTGTRDTASRLKGLLTKAGLRVSVMRSTIETTKREDWVVDQVERGVDVLVCNPDLVKTGLDLLDFPTIVYMQTGYNVYTLMQASRRSWRIGQKLPVKVLFLGYARSAQSECLGLMAKKIAVSQSTSGDMPESGLDILNDAGDSIEVALAKQLVA